MEAYRQLPDSAIELLAPDPDSTKRSTDSFLQQQGHNNSQVVVATCKVLIGADGWFSPIRQQVLADGPPTFKDCVVWRARIQKPDWMPAARTKWWVPPHGPRQAEMLAVFIPVPGGDTGLPGMIAPAAPSQ